MKVIIVDDDQLVVSALKTILSADPGIQVVATGADGQDAVALFDKLRPDVLLMDIRMRHVSGLDAAEHILSVYPCASILFLTTFADDEYIIRALHLGAKGYLLKQNFESIVPALKAVFTGQRVFGDEVITKLPRYVKREKDDYREFGLNEKEFEVIQLVAEGLNNKETAQRLFLSEGTVRNYLSVIFEKLALRDRTQLAVFYYKHF
ncbi:MAG: response regulator transcription factor [Firmicutes bacterium]|nr:response regulator transcription factor [Bacillota bacterium]